MVGTLQVRQIKKEVSVRKEGVVFQCIKDFSPLHDQLLGYLFINYTKAENKRLTDLKFINAGTEKKSAKINSIKFTN
jgi:hypothetical protein